MNTIQINEEYRAVYDGRQYALERYDEGGNEVRNPKTGETVKTQPGWRSEGRHYTRIDHAVEYVVRNTASEEAGDLNEFLDIQERTRLGVMASEDMK